MRASHGRSGEETDRVIGPVKLTAMLASVDVHFGVPGNTPYQWAVFGLLVVTKDLPAWQWTRPPSAGTTIWSGSCLLTWR
jgi:hypothetical protein